MITVNLYYKGENGNARAFAEEMESSGIADAIRAEKGNLRYQYFTPIEDPETVLLIDSWTDQSAIDESSVLFGMISCFRTLQPEKAALPIFFNVLGSSISSSSTQA